MLSFVSASTEAASVLNYREFQGPVVALHQGLLRRLPDADGYTFFNAALIDGSTTKDGHLTIVLGSREFQDAPNFTGPEFAGAAAANTLQDDDFLVFGDALVGSHTSGGLPADHGFFLAFANADGHLDANDLVYKVSGAFTGQVFDVLGDTTFFYD